MGDGRDLDPGDLFGDGGAGSSAIQISPTLYSTFFLKDGVAVGCGNNSRGHLGVNDPFIDVYRKPKALPFPAGTLIAQVHAGGHGGAAIDTDGHVYTWGGNMTGELGTGNLDPVDLPAPVRQPLTDVDGATFDHVRQLALGYQFVGARRDDGSVWVWGLNGFDKAGTPANGVTGLPLPLGDCPWGGPGVANCYATLPRKITFPAGVVVREIFASDFAMMAIDTDDAVWSWGGLAGTDSKDTNVPVKWPGLPRIRTVAMGRGSVYAIDFDKSLWAWGVNYGPTTKLSDKPEFAMFAGHAAGISVSGHSIHVLDDAGQLWGWGDQQVGEVGNGPTGIDVNSVDANGCLNAGYDYATKDLVPAPVKVLDEVATVSSNAFSYSVFAVKLDGSVWAWGRNKNFGLCNDPPPNPAGKDCSPNPYPVDTFAVGVPTQIKPF